MTNRCPPHRLPRDVDQTLLRLAENLRSAPRVIRESLSSGDDVASKLHRVAGWLYSTWYSAIPPQKELQPLPVGRENLASALRASVCASTQWEAGWVALRCTTDGICLAGRDHQTRELRPGEYANLTRRGLPVAPGDSIAVTKLVEWLDAATGFWCTRSWKGEPRNPLVRLYLSVGCDHVGYVLAEVTRRLDKLEIFYSLKCPSLAAAYSRVDSVVVYLQADAWTCAAPTLTAASRQLRAHLRNMTPPLTKRIAPGVAFAENPASHQSFGESRCAALAPGALMLLGKDGFRAVDGVTVLAESLQGAGIDPTQPWLNSVQYG